MTDVPAADLTFDDASRELTTILADLESDRLGVDDVVVRVRRAAELITVCRGKLTGAQTQVAQIVADLATDTPSA